MYTSSSMMRVIIAHIENAHIVNVGLRLIGKTKAEMRGKVSLAQGKGSHADQRRGVALKKEEVQL